MLLYYTNCLLKLIADIMNRFIFFKTILLSFLLFHTGFSSAQIADLSKASIIASSTIAHPVRETAIRVLQEEVAQRTSINLRLISRFENTPVIILASTKYIGIQQNNWSSNKTTGLSLGWYYMPGQEEPLSTNEMCQPH